MSVNEGTKLPCLRDINSQQTLTNSESLLKVKVSGIPAYKTVPQGLKTSTAEFVHTWYLEFKDPENWNCLLKQ